jgi:hypothetical protein
MVPMRRVFDRKASFSDGNALAAELAPSLAKAEAEQRGAPDSRDRTIALYRGLMGSGRIGEAQELTARWSQRDALDPDALVARADLAAMRGERARALRILSGLVDVRPNDKAMHRRLVAAFDAMGAPDRACHHRVALADLGPLDVGALSAAHRCAQDRGLGRLAEALLASAPAAERSRIESASRALDLGKPVPLAGDVRIAAQWQGAADLDLALVDKQGRRTSWSGTVAPTVKVGAKDASSLSGETLALAGLAAGNYLLEVVRTDGAASAGPVVGEVTLTLPGGETRKLPFRLAGARAEIGTLRIFFTSRLVPVDSWGGGGGGGGWRGDSLGF